MADAVSTRTILARADDGRQVSVLGALRDLDAMEVPSVSARLHLLRNFTLEPLLPFARLASYRRGVKLDVTLSDFDAYYQELLDPASSLRRSRCDLVFLALSLDQLALVRNGNLDADAVADHVEDVVSKLRDLTAGAIAVATFLPPIVRSAVWSGWAELAKLNRRVHELAALDPRVIVVDLAALGVAARADIHDERFWHMHRSPFSSAMLRALGEELATLLARGLGLGRKVAVLDCDNTLWGGIVGEDGPTGIHLDPNEYPGCAFHAFQRQLLELQRAGVLLALCSKNNERDVMEVLQSHPHMVIRSEHLATWEIGWDNKADGLRRIAATLNLGLDSMVFIDDSAVECQLVRDTLPMVDVLQAPASVHELPALLRSYRGFISAALTDEDRGRTASYLAERLRQSAAGHFTDMDAFLASLGLEVEIGAPRSDEMDRVVQLLQRTNQFNLTTRRHSVGDVLRYAADSNAAILMMKVRDRYGEYGLTGLAIATRTSSEVAIDSFLMSCRVLGRKVEDVLLIELLATIRRRWGNARVVAEFRQTEKNMQVAEFFDSRSFRVIVSDTAHKLYEAEVALTPAEPPRFIAITRRDDA